MTDQLNLNLPEGLADQEEKDTLGGGNGAVESAIYKGMVELAYLDAAPSGAQRITIHFKPNDSDNVLKNTTYISNKQGQFTYNDRNSGEPKPLPGYSQMNSFFKAITGKDIGNQATAVKTIKVYDFEKKAEVPKEVNVFTDTVNKPIAVGVLKVKEEKTRKESQNPANPPYSEGTGEYREINEFDKYFNADDGRTITEIANNAQNPDFFMQWKDKHTGNTRVKNAKIPGATTGAAAGAPNTATVNTAAAAAPRTNPFA